MHGRRGARVGRSVVSVCLALALLGVLVACSMLVDMSGLTNGPSGVETGPQGGGEGGSGGSSSGGGGDPSSDGSTPSGDGGALVGSTYRDVVMADGPLAYFRLDETTYGVAKDETGRFQGVHRGNLALGVPPLVAGGGGAARFDRSGRIEVDGLDFQGNAPFTLELWLSKTATHADYDFPFYKEMGTGSQRRGYGVVVIQDYLAGERFVGGNGFDVVANGVGAGRIVHFVMTYDGATLSLWIDGELVQSRSDTRSQSPVTAPALIGGTVNDGFDGTIDELAVYDKVLPRERIQAHYAAGRRP